MKNIEDKVLREVHDIRLANYERTKNMSSEERSELIRQETKDVIERYGQKVVSVERAAAVVRVG